MGRNQKGACFYKTEYGISLAYKIINLPGDDMYRSSLKKAIEGQQKAREAITLPDYTWTIDD